MHLEAAIHKFLPLSGLFLSVLFSSVAYTQPTNFTLIQEQKIDESILRFIKEQPVLLKWNQKLIRISLVFPEDMDNCKYARPITEGRWAEIIKADTHLDFRQHTSTWKPKSWSVPDSEIVFLFGSERRAVFSEINEYLNSQIRLNPELSVYRYSFDPFSLPEYRGDPSNSFRYEYFYLAQSQNLKRIFIGAFKPGRGCPSPGLTEDLLSYPSVSAVPFDKDVIAAAIHFSAIAERRAIRMLYSIDTSRIDSPMALCKALEAKMRPSEPSICNK